MIIKPNWKRLADIAVLTLGCIILGRHTDFYVGLGVFFIVAVLLANQWDNGTLKRP